MTEMGGKEKKNQRKKPTFSPPNISIAYIHCLLNTIAWFKIQVFKFRLILWIDVSTASSDDVDEVFAW